MKSLGETNFDTHRLALTFSAPGALAAHYFRQAFGMDAKTSFEKAVSNRKCVIELGLAREAAHTKIVKPIEQTGMAVSAYNDVDAQLLSEHEDGIAYHPRCSVRCRKFLAASESAN